MSDEPEVHPADDPNFSLKSDAVNPILMAGGSVYTLCYGDEDSWIGNEDGPFYFTKEKTARKAAEMEAIRLGVPPTAIQVKPVEGLVKKVTLSRVIDSKVSNAEAQARLNNLRSN